MSNENNKGQQQKPAKFVFDPLLIATDEKTDKKFGNAFNTLIAYVGGRKGLKKTKVGSSEMDTVLKELYEEELEISKKALKEDIRQFLKDFGDFKSETTKAFNVMVAAVKEQKAKFAERASKLNSNISDLNGFMATKADLLKVEGIGAVVTTKEEEEDTDPDSGKQE
jgi:hypothetical protein